MKAKQLDGQLTFELFEQPTYTPGNCPNETRRYKSKSFCKPWDRYTNCREVGHCVYMDCSGNAL